MTGMGALSPSTWAAFGSGIGVGTTLTSADFFNVFTPILIYIYIIICLYYFLPFYNRENP